MEFIEIVVFPLLIGIVGIPTFIQSVRLNKKIRSLLLRYGFTPHEVYERRSLATLRRIRELSNSNPEFKEEYEELSMHETGKLMLGMLGRFLLLAAIMIALTLHLEY
jgi:hypothetical protein